MAQYEGKTPEQLAAEIMTNLTKPVLLEISGVAAENLNLVLRYKFAKKIYSKGEKWFLANLESLRTEFIEGLIEAQYDQRKKADERQAESDKWEFVNSLIARGFTRFKALEMAGFVSEQDFEAQKKLDAAEAEKQKAAAAVPAKK